MRPIQPQDHRGIFRQLSQTPGSAGVKSVIENHDAWVQSAELLTSVTPAMRLELAARARQAGVAERISTNRAALARLITRVPNRLSDAG